MRGFLVVGALVAAVAMLPACSNSSNSSDNAGNAAAEATEAPSAAASVAQDGASANDGATVYSANCASCHQSNGAGLSGAFPPLAGNPVVTGDATQLIHIVKYGLSGKIAVAGHTYNGTMPAWAQNLSDAQIASALTFVRASWGNRASAVATADVTAVKK